MDAVRFDVDGVLVSSSPHRWIDIVRDRFDLAFDEVVSADSTLILSAITS